MKEGLRWVIGDGNSINIYKDKWLRGRPNFSVENTTTTEVNREAKVCEFFVRNQKIWDEVKVKSTFNNDDADAILAVRIPQSNICDRVAWFHSTNGIYSVKSGYHFWLSSNSNVEIVQQTDGWGKLWKLCVPSKIKVFLWRLCRNTVPVRNQLRGKGIDVPITCPLCNRDVEHLLHLFFDCAFASSCWQYVGLWYDMREVEFAAEWFLSKLSTESSDNLMKIAAVIWGVWWARNQMIWEGKQVCPEMATNWSLKQIFDWKKAQDNKKNNAKNLQRDKMQYTNRWLTPDPGTLKLNVDASVPDGVESYSVGMVMRDHNGSFLQGRVMKFSGRVAVLEAELVGIMEALKWCSDFGEQKIIVESDSLLSVQGIKGGVQNRLEEGAIIEHCRFLLGRQALISLGFVKKQANKVAHLLARQPCTRNSFIDFSSPPQSVLETLMSDI